MNSNVKIKLENVVDDKESDRFVSFIKHHALGDVQCEVQLSRGWNNDTNTYDIDIEISKRIYIREFVCLLLACRNYMPDEYSDLDHVFYTVDLTIEDIDSKFVFYDDDVVVNTLNIVAQELDEQINRVDQLVEFINDQKLSSYDEFRTVVMSVLEKQGLVEYTKVPLH